MSEQKAMQFASGWDKLPKQEQEKVKKQLKALPDKEPANSKPKPKNGFQLRGYVRCELSSVDKEAFKEWESGLGEDSRLGLLMDLVEGGYLFKVGDTGSGFQASLCASTTGKLWEGYVLTAHASYAVRAARLVLYKHEVMMQGDWSAWMSEEGEDFIR
jgi:hypothetical protein